MNQKVERLGKQILTFSLLGLLAVGCTNNMDPTDQSLAGGDEGGVTEVTSSMLRALPEAPGMVRNTVEDLPKPVLTDSVTKGDKILEAIREGIKGVIISRTVMYNSGVSFNEYLLFNPMSSIAYPGNVIVGSSILDGTYRPVNRQKVGKVSYSTSDLTPRSQSVSFVRSVDNPTYSKYSEVLQYFRSVPSLTPGAQTTFEMRELKSQREIGITLGLGLDFGKFAADFSIGTTWGNNKTHILVKYVQKLYSVSMDLPDDLILKEADVKSFDGVMPVYISEVYYGRTAYALISNNYDYKETLAALKIVLGGLSIKLDTTTKKVLDESFFKFAFVGGDSKAQGLTATKGWDGFKQAISTPLQVSEAVPVAMTLRYVDDNSVARVMLSGAYPVKESHFIPNTDEITFTVRPSSISGKAGNRKELYLNGKVSITTPDGREHVIFDRARSQYVKLGENNTAPFDDPTTYPITLKRPKDMSMLDFLNQEVTFKASFRNTNANGTSNGDDLGGVEETVKVQDLIFYSIRGYYSIDTRRNTRKDYEATFNMEITHNIKGITDIPNSIN